MSIAWPALVILVTLMPGFFFFVGIYSRELYGRDASASDAVSKLAPIVIVSFFANAVLVALAHVIPLCPDVSFRIVLSTISPEAHGALGLAALSKNLQENVGWIALYVAAGCSMGVASGKVIAGLVVSGKWKLGVAHPWVYGLTAESEDRLTPTYAFVLSKTPRKDIFELYRGPLDRFGLSPDGRFSHLVLLAPEKCKTVRDESGEMKEFSWEAVGKETGEVVQRRLLYIDMENVHNVVFETYPAITDLDAKTVSEILANVLASTSP